MTSAGFWYHKVPGAHLGDRKFVGAWPWWKDEEPEKFFILPGLLIRSLEPPTIIEMPKVKVKFGDPKTVIACIRVSDERQELSPDAQRRAIEAYCDKHGLTLAKVCVETVTSVAPLEERYGLMEAMAALRPNNAGVLLFLNRDRLARDIFLAKMIEREAVKNGAVVATVDGANGDSPQDEFQRNIMDSAATFERAMIRKRTRECLEEKRHKGEPIGGLPYGLKWEDGAWVPNLEEQVVIAEAKRLRSEGMSYQMIARRLPYLNRRGKPFGKTQIIKMLTVVQSTHAQE